MAPPKVDPWFSPKEWQRVYHLLYSSNHSSKKQGLDHVTMWSARSQRLPLAVECTGELVAATLLKGPGQVAAYSLAVIRFVNGHVDKGQGAVYARSVAGVASELGIPDWVVDIRHEATHKGIPCLERLEMAARCALSWLEEKYWSPQNLCLERGEERVREGLVGYLAVQERLREMRNHGKKTNKTEIAHCVEQIGSWSRYELGLLPGIMLESLQRSSFHFPLWKPLLIQLHKTKPNVVAHLLYTLCKHYSSNSQHRQDIASFILSLISDDLFSEHCKAQHSLYVETLLRSVNDMDTRSLCGDILNHCSDKLNSTYRQLNKLICIAKSAGTVDSTSDLDIAKQVDTMKDTLKALEEKSKERSKKKARFEKCSSAVWESLPLGSTPEDIFPPLELDSIAREENTEDSQPGDDSDYLDEIENNISVEVDHLKTLRDSKYFTKQRLEELAASVHVFDNPDSYC